ncbi:MAG TPA: hypothetical protein VN520_16160 [Streptomyces sp.]|nr:hypothetical protein [Streptomyces sp.]HWU07890.1 hypothetical protein [Streptomyces sp.]
MTPPPRKPPLPRRTPRADATAKIQEAVDARDVLAPVIRDGAPR